MLYVSHISRKLRKKLYEKVYSFHSVLCWSASLCWLARAKSVHLYRKLEIDRDGRVYHKKKWQIYKPRFLQDFLVDNWLRCLLLCLPYLNLAGLMELNLYLFPKFPFMCWYLLYKGT